MLPVFRDAYPDIVYRLASKQTAALSAADTEEERCSKQEGLDFVSLKSRESVPLRIFYRTRFVHGVGGSPASDFSIFGCCIVGCTG